jgi:hypothetical protein
MHLNSRLSVADVNDAEQAAVLLDPPGAAAWWCHHHEVTRRANKLASRASARPETGCMNLSLRAV